MDLRDPKRSGIYTITNLKNHRIYVGSAVLIERRWKTHASMLRRGAHPSKWLQSAWTKHGEEHFLFAIVEYVERREDLIAREQSWIDRLSAFGPLGYNLTPRAGSQLGFKMSDEAKAKMARAKLGATRVFSEEHRARLSEANRRRFPTLQPMKCVECDGPIKGARKRKFCSLACKAKNLNVTIVCKSCGASFSVYRSWAIGSKKFCSRPCFYKHQKDLKEGD